MGDVEVRQSGRARGVEGKIGDAVAALQRRRSDMVEWMVNWIRLRWLRQAGAAALRDGLGWDGCSRCLDERAQQGGERGSAA